MMESAKSSHFGQVSMILGVFLMYISSNEDQLSIEDFFMPFGGKLLKTNRWVKIASMMPWEPQTQSGKKSPDGLFLTGRTPCRFARYAPRASWMPASPNGSSSAAFHQKA